MVKRRAVDDGEDHASRGPPGHRHLEEEGEEDENKAGGKRANNELGHFKMASAEVQRQRKIVGLDRLGVGRKRAAFQNMAVSPAADASRPTSSPFAGFAVSGETSGGASQSVSKTTPFVDFPLGSKTPSAVPSAPQGFGSDQQSAAKPSPFAAFSFGPKAPPTVPETESSGGAPQSAAKPSPFAAFSFGSNAASTVRGAAQCESPGSGPQAAAKPSPLAGISFGSNVPPTVSDALQREASGSALQSAAKPSPFAGLSFAKVPHTVPNALQCESSGGASQSAAKLSPFAGFAFGANAPSTAPDTLQSESSGSDSQSAAKSSPFAGFAFGAKAPSAAPDTLQSESSGSDSQSAAKPSPFAGFAFGAKAQSTAPDTLQFESSGGDSQSAAKPSPFSFGTQATRAASDTPLSKGAPSTGGLGFLPNSPSMFKNSNKGATAAATPTGVANESSSNFGSAFVFQPIQQNSPKNEPKLVAPGAAAEPVPSPGGSAFVTPRKPAAGARRAADELRTSGHYRISKVVQQAPGLSPFASFAFAPSHESPKAATVAGSSTFGSSPTGGAGEGAEIRAGAPNVVPAERAKSDVGFHTVATPRVEHTPGEARVLAGSRFVAPKGESPAPHGAFAATPGNNNVEVGSKNEEATGNAGGSFRQNQTDQGYVPLFQPQRRREQSEAERQLNDLYTSLEELNAKLLNHLTDMAKSRPLDDLSDALLNYRKERGHIIGVRCRAAAEKVGLRMPSDQASASSEPSAPSKCAFAPATSSGPDGFRSIPRPAMSARSSAFSAHPQSASASTFGTPPPFDVPFLAEKVDLELPPFPKPSPTKPQPSSSGIPREEPGSSAETPVELDDD